jgi:hypothetical protein
MENRQRDSEFEDTTNAYATAIRWGEFDVARHMMRLADPQSSKQPPVGNVKVTAYETLRTTHTTDGNEVNITVRIDYYHMDTMKVKSITDQQVWKYDNDDQHWYITTALPEFK